MNSRQIREESFKANIRYGYLRFGMQAAVSLAGMAFSAAMIGTRDGVEGVYLPIITGIIGFWLPSPSFPVSVENPANKTAVSKIAGARIAVLGPPTETVPGPSSSAGAAPSALPVSKPPKIVDAV